MVPLGFHLTDGVDLPRIAYRCIGRIAMRGTNMRPIYSAFPSLTPINLARLGGRICRTRAVGISTLGTYSALCKARLAYCHWTSLGYYHRNLAIGPNYGGY